MLKKFGIFLILVLSEMVMTHASFSTEYSRKPSGIFETDTRKWVLEKSPLSTLSESIAIQVPRSRVKNFDEISPPFYTLSGPTYKDEWNTCTGTRFNAESSTAVCTAFLVGKKTLLTAGHCGVVNESGCRNNIWVFDYTKDSKTISTKLTMDPYYPFEETILKDSVYHCHQILSKGYNQTTGLDYSLIELDREVTDRKPVKFFDWSKGNPQSLFTIGALAGTRLVSVKPKAVVEVTPSEISAPFTLFAKGSGGPVFDAKTKSVVGIAVKSSLDFLFNKKENCFNEWILKSPWTKEITLPSGEKKKIPYSTAERIDWIHSQTGILNLIK